MQIYRVRRGESIEDIARRFGVGAEKILSDSNCRREQVDEGIRLVIMRPDGEEYIVKPFDTLEGIAVRFNVSEKYIEENNNLSSSAVFIGQKLYI